MTEWSQVKNKSFSELGIVSQHIAFFLITESGNPLTVWLKKASVSYWKKNRFIYF